MAFDRKRWQSEVRAWWEGHGPRIKAAPIESAYALLATSAWLPFLAAYVEDPGPAMTALVGVTAGIGSNLVANVVQNIYGRARGGEQVTDQAREDAQTRAEVDAILQATQALEAAQEVLGERWDDFARRLAQEIAALPGQSSLTVTLGDGTLVEGSLVAGDLKMKDSTFAGRDYTHIETQTVQINVPPADRTKEIRERALHTYLERLAGECNVLYLRGMDPRAADVTSQETMSLAAVYTALDTNLRVVPLSDEELSTLKTKRGRRERSPLVIEEGRPDEAPERPMTAVEAASQIDRLVLLGEPGAGKSTFVNYLTFQLAWVALEAGQSRTQFMEQTLPGWERGPLIPIRVILRDLARFARPGETPTTAALWRSVERSLAEAHLADAVPALEDRLDGRVILLLDGLDEVDADARRWIQEAVDQFALTHVHAPILVTCRVYAYQDAEWRLARFQQATLAPFDEEKMDHFIRAWYAEVAQLGLLSVTESNERSARLREAVRRPDLRALAPNPLLLTMMALLHSSWGRLPEDRVQLYSEIVELLLARWEQSRLGREALTRARLSPRNLRFALEEVAYNTHRIQPAGEGTADVAEHLLREVLAERYLEQDYNRAGDVIRYIRERTGLLLERKPHIYAFPHRTLQEYLTGCYLSVQPDFSVQVADLLRKDETRWREPFLLAVGKTARAENRIDLALTVVDNLCPRACSERAEGNEGNWRCAWLAGEALVEIGVDALRRRDAWRVRLERVADWLAQLLEAGALKPVERASAGRVLAHLGDPRPGVGIDLETGLPDIAWCKVPAGPFLMGSSEGDENTYSDERPRHTVEVDGFSISKYPVTNEQYARFVEAGGYEERRYWTRTSWDWRTGVREPDLSTIDDKDLRQRYADWLAQRPPEKRDRPFWWDNPTWNPPNHPVVGVSWFEALAYTRWLADVTGRPCRLPTEAEWEKAARGIDGRTYPWGDEWAEDRTNTSEAEIGRTTAVGAFPAGASPCGALDMSGNVLEWCSSVGFTEAPYPYQADDGREDMERDVFRAVRGGSWSFDRRDARCAYRYLFHPDFFIGVGLRVIFPGSPPSDSCPDMTTNQED